MKLIFIALLLCSFSFALANLSACGDITVADTYLLNTSLVSAGDCLNITAADVVLDGMGYTISGDGTGYGIKMGGNSINVSNITINGFQRAVSVTGGLGRFENSTILNSTHGIYNDNAQLVHIKNNSITTTNASIRFQNSLGLVMHHIVNNTLTCSATNGGFTVPYEGCLHFEQDSKYYNITRNNITHTSSTGKVMVFYVSAASQNLIYDNYFSNSNILPLPTANLSFNITKNTGTNIIGGANIGGNYWADTPLYDTDNDGIGNGDFVTFPPFYDYLPLTNLLGGYFVSPTPSSPTSDELIQMAFNYSITNMTNCSFEILGNNYTGIMDTTNTTCYYNFTASSHTAYTIKGWAIIGAVTRPTNETVTMCYLACGYGGSLPPPPPPPEAPPSGGGGGGAIVSPSSVATAIIEASNGNIETLPVNCTPFFSTKFRFIGATQADKISCEFKGLGGLYIKRVGSFVNFAMIFLGFFIYMGYSVENKKSASFYVFGGLSIITLVLTYDLLAFSATAAILSLAGGRLT